MLKPFAHLFRRFTKWVYKCVTGGQEDGESLRLWIICLSKDWMVNIYVILIVLFQAIKLLSIEFNLALNGLLESWIEVIFYDLLCARLSFYRNVLNDSILVSICSHGLQVAV